MRLLRRGPDERATRKLRRSGHRPPDRPIILLPLLVLPPLIFQAAEPFLFEERSTTVTSGDGGEVHDGGRRSANSPESELRGGARRALAFARRRRTSRGLPPSSSRRSGRALPLSRG